MQETKALRTVYDFGESSMRWGVALYPLIFTIIGVIIIAYALKTHSEKNNRAKEFIGGLIFVVGSLLIMNTLLNNSDYKKTKNILVKGDYKTVQDTVRNYRKEYHRNNWNISFDLGNVHFDLSDNNVINYGCTASDIKDRRIMDGVFLYIDYIVSDSGNKILRIKRE